MNESNKAVASVKPSGAVSEWQHTPGPWAVCAVAPNAHWMAGSTIGAANPSDARRICDVTEVNVPMGKANARLIAAAPELLAALIDARQLLAFARCPVEFIDAAISKALGEQQ